MVPSAKRMEQGAGRKDYNRVYAESSRLKAEGSKAVVRGPEAKGWTYRSTILSTIESV